MNQRHNKSNQSWDTLARDEMARRKSTKRGMRRKKNFKQKLNKHKAKSQTQRKRPVILTIYVFVLWSAFVCHIFLCLSPILLHRRSLSPTLSHAHQNKVVKKIDKNENLFSFREVLNVEWSRMMAISSLISPPPQQQCRMSLSQWSFDVPETHGARA